MKRILLIDDSTIFARVLERILKDNFHVIAHAKDGLKGIELYRLHQPDLVLLDITMPNMSGKDCLVNLIREFPSAKILMVSSLGDEHTISECIEYGAKGFVDKESVRVGTLSENPKLKAEIHAVFGESFLEAA